MLSDLLILESYYDGPETAVFFEDLCCKYGMEPIRKALHAGDVILHRLQLGPDYGRDVLWLSDKGRGKARALSD